MFVVRNSLKVWIFVLYTYEYFGILNFGILKISKMNVFTSEIWKILYLFGIENPGGKICPLLKYLAKLGKHHW